MSDQKLDLEDKLEGINQMMESFGNKNLIERLKKLGIKADRESINQNGNRLGTQALKAVIE